MAIPVKQSTAQSFSIFMADSADGKTGKTGLTLAVTLKKYGETSFSSISPTQREIGNGHYEIDLTTTHMNTVGLCSIRATATGADPADCPNCIDVVAYDKTSATRGTAGTALPDVASGSAGAIITSGTGTAQISVTSGRAKADTTHWDGTAVATPTTAGVPRVDVKAMEAGVVTATAVADGAIDRATFAQDALDTLGEVRRFTAAAGSTTTVTLDAGAVATDDYYKNLSLLCVSGTGSGQAATISSYVGATKVATLDRTVATAFDNTSIFELRASGGGGGGLSAGATAAAVWDEPRASHTTAGTFGQGAASVQGAVTGAVGSVTGNVGGNVTGSVGSIASGGLSFASLAADLVAALGIVRRNTAQAGGATSLTLDASASATDDIYNGMTGFIASGTGVGQEFVITDYVGSTKVATIQSTGTAGAWPVTNPDNTSVFVLLTANMNINRLLSWAYRSGRTVRGLFRRLSSAVEVATGLTGSTATFKQPDGSTTEFSVTQNPSAGTRTAVDVTNSETP